MDIESFLKALVFYIASEIFKAVAENIVKDEQKSAQDLLDEFNSRGLLISK